MELELFDQVADALLAIAPPELGQMRTQPRRWGGWQRVSETWADPDLSDPELCFEVADRLATYLTVLEPLRSGAPA